MPAPRLELQLRVAAFLDAETARLDALVERRQAMVELLNERRVVVMLNGVRGLFTSMRARVESSVPWLNTHPDDWRDVKLTLVARLGSGHTPSRAHPEWWADATVPWVTTGEVIQMRSDRLEFIEKTREKISELGLANSAAVVHPAGTVVLCRTAASAGYSAIMGTDMATSQDFATWTCGPLLRPRFLLLCLRAMRSDLLGRLAMGSTHKTIYMPDLEAVRIPLPPVGEQDEIIEEVQRRLWSIDRVIETLTGQIALLKERRQALITAAVTGELDVTKGAA
jgi:type I restriction enzyme S subunit